MRETFHQQLDELAKHVVEMADWARGMLRDAVQSFVALDAVKAKEVEARKDRLAKMDDDIEEEALLLVARQQPMARDMRAVAAALKLITYINRVGRYGKDIAQITQQWGSNPHMAKLVQIPMMAQVVERMLDMVMTAYKTRSRFDLKQLTEWEETLDATRWTVWRESLTYMAQNAANIESGSHYMMAARYLERSGDNVCKMAEKTHYMVTGERLQIR